MRRQNVVSRAFVFMAATARPIAAAGLFLLLGPVVAAQEKDSSGSGGENASNPLASVSNTDIKYQYFDLGGADRNDMFADGAYMLNPKLKLR